MTVLLTYGLSVILVNILAVLAGTQNYQLDLKPLVISEHSSSPEPSVVKNEQIKNSSLLVASSKAEVSVSPTIAASPDNLVKVVKVVDGQTLLLANGREVKYSGVSIAANLDEEGCVSGQDVLKQRELVENKWVRIEGDGQNDGKAFVYLSDGTLVNVWLVKEGLARAEVTVKYVSELQAAEQQAQANQNGLWSKVCVKATAGNASVKVKQNINSSSSVNSSTKIKIKNRN